MLNYFFVIKHQHFSDDFFAHLKLILLEKDFMPVNWSVKLVSC
jgi:hypothetical protein